MTIPPRLSLELGLKPFKAACKQGLTPAMKSKRLTFGKQNETYTVEE